MCRRNVFFVFIIELIDLWTLLGHGAFWECCRWALLRLHQVFQRQPVVQLQWPARQQGQPAQKEPFLFREAKDTICCFKPSKDIWMTVLGLFLILIWHFYGPFWILKPFSCVHWTLSLIALWSFPSCVLQITQDDIRKTYGGSSGSRGYYSSAFARYVRPSSLASVTSKYDILKPIMMRMFVNVFNSSTNAYMLMYRLKDPSRNASKGFEFGCINGMF